MLPTLHLSHDEEIVPPGAHRFSNVDRFVPMNEYDEAHMLEDFEYLQFLGRSISSLGRDLVKRGWMKREQAGTAQQGPAGRPGSTQNGPSGRPSQQRSERLPAEQRNRQQFEGWIRRLRLPIMLLPDGMSARKENQSRWKAQAGQLQCTVQVAFPTGDQSDRRARRAILHHVSWTRTLSDVVIGELGKRLRLPAADSSTCSPWTALIGKDVATSKSDVTMDKIRDTVMLAVPVHSEKLRNESSAKFLEWWQRQVRYGMVKPGGLQLDEEKRAELERARRGDWAPIEGLPDGEGEVAMTTGRGATDEKQQERPESSAGAPAAAHSGLISAALLSRLQAQRDANVKEAAEEVASFSQDRVASEGDKPIVRSLVVLEGDETIEQLLRGMHNGLAIVEYPHVEVWDKLKLLRLFAQGKARRETLARQAFTQSADNRTAEGAKHARQEEEGEMKAAQDVVKKARLDAAAKGIASTPSALMDLSAYASSDEESEEGEQLADVVQLSTSAEEVTESGSLADIARALGMAPSLAAAVRQPGHPDAAISSSRDGE